MALSKLLLLFSSRCYWNTSSDKFNAAISEKSNSKKVLQMLEKQTDCQEKLQKLSILVYPNLMVVGYFLPPLNCSPFLLVKLLMMYNFLNDYILFEIIVTPMLKRISVSYLKWLKVQRKSPKWPMLRNQLKIIQDLIGSELWAFATENQVIRQLLSYLMWKIDKEMRKCWLLPCSFLPFMSLDYVEFICSVDLNLLWWRL